MDRYRSTCSCDILASSVFPHFFFFSFLSSSYSSPSPPPYSLSLFSNHDREKRFVRSNDAQWSTCGARLFVERRNLNREPRLPRGAVITRIFSTAKDLYASFLVRARARARVPQEGRGGEERRKTVKSKHHVLHDDHVETRARWRREAATAGIRAVHARTLSPFPLSRLPFVILYIFITPLHHRVPMHSLHRLFFLLSFSRLSFHLRGHAHASPRLLFIDTRARPEFRNGI